MQPASAIMENTIATAGVPSTVMVLTELPIVTIVFLFDK
jgi:hypothetical protein